MKAILLVLLLSGCGTLLSGALGSLGGGPSLDAQVGQNNTKQIVGQQSSITADRGGSVDASRPQLRSDRVESVTINQAPLWVWLAMVLGWMLPSPGEIGRKFMGLFKK